MGTILDHPTMYLSENNLVIWIWGKIVLEPSADQWATMSKKDTARMSACIMALLPTLNIMEVKH
jgi:hypothetical protein